MLRWKVFNLDNIDKADSSIAIVNNIKKVREQEEVNIEEGKAFRLKEISEARGKLKINRASDYTYIISEMLKLLGVQRTKILTIPAQTNFLCTFFYFFNFSFAHRFTIKKQLTSLLVKV